MSKHNYSQYSNKKNSTVSTEATDKDTSMTIPSFEPAIVPSAISRTPEVKMVVDTVDTLPMPKMVEGVVVNCTKLNVRAEPNSDADVVYILDVMSEIKIDVNKSDNEWFRVCTASGVEGYCMRKFVDAYL